MSGSGISWDICKSAPHSRQITMPAPHRSVFYRPDALPATQPTVSKHWRQKYLTTILRLSYDNATVTIDLRRTANLQNICQAFLTHNSPAKSQDRLRQCSQVSSWLSKEKSQHITDLQSKVNLTIHLWRIIRYLVIWAPGWQHKHYTLAQWLN